LFTQTDKEQQEARARNLTRKEEGKENLELFQHLMPMLS
jgi:hypothetical protein